MCKFVHQLSFVAADAKSTPASVSKGTGGFGLCGRGGLFSFDAAAAPSRAAAVFFAVVVGAGHCISCKRREKLFLFDPPNAVVFWCERSPLRIGAAVVEPVFAQFYGGKQRCNLFEPQRRHVAGDDHSVLRLAAAFGSAAAENRGKMSVPPEAVYRRRPGAAPRSFGQRQQPFRSFY